MVFQKYRLPITEKAIEELIDVNILQDLLVELNQIVGSSYVTCIEGG